MRHFNGIRRALLVAFVLGGASLRSNALAESEPVLGSWAGNECYRGECKPIAVRFALYKPKNDALVMYYDNPQMKFINLGPMSAKRSGSRYSNSLFELTLADDQASLNGKKTFDGHELALTLKRGALPDTAPDAPTSAPIATPAWTFATGGPIWSSPAVVDGSVYFGSNDKNVYAVDAATGKERWRFATNGAVMGRVTVDGANLYTLSDDGFLYKLDRRKGAALWKFDTHAGEVARDMPSETSKTYDYLASAATVSAGVVYVGSANGKLYAIDADSGSERWHFDTQGIVRSIPAVADGRVYFGSYDHHVYALDARSGKLIWQHDTLEPVVSSALVFDSTVYVGSRNSDLFAFDAATGAVRWTFFYWASWVESSTQMRDRTLYIGSSDYQYVFAIDPASGKERWRRNVDGSPWSTPAVTATRVYTGAVGTHPYFIDHHGGFFALDRASGTIVWRYPMPAAAGVTMFGASSSPAVDHGRVFFGGLDGTFYAFRAE